MTSDPKVATHTSEGKKRKVTDTSNGNLHQKLLMNRTLPIITTPIDPRISDRVVTCVGTSHASTTPTTNPVIMDAARSSARVLRTPHGHLSRTGRYGTTPQDRDISGPGNGTVLIGVNVSPTRTGSQYIVNPHGSTVYVEVKDTQIFHTSIDENLANDGDYTPIFSKVIR